MAFFDYLTFFALHLTFFLHFYLTEKHQICILYWKIFIKKRTTLNNCLKNYLKIFSINYVECHVNTKKDHLCFHENSTIQTFIFISSKVVYFKKHLVSIAPLENKVFTVSNILYCRQTITLAAGAIVEPLQTCLKDVLRNLLFGCI